MSNIQTNDNGLVLSYMFNRQISSDMFETLTPAKGELIAGGLGNLVGKAVESEVRQNFPKKANSGSHLQQGQESLYANSAYAAFQEIKKIGAGSTYTMSQINQLKKDVDKFSNETATALDQAVRQAINPRKHYTVHATEGSTAAVDMLITDIKTSLENINAKIVAGVELKAKYGSGSQYKYTSKNVNELFMSNKTYGRWLQDNDHWVPIEFGGIGRMNPTAWVTNTRTTWFWEYISNQMGSNNNAIAIFTKILQKNRQGQQDINKFIVSLDLNMKNASKRQVNIIHLPTMLETIKANPQRFTMVTPANPNPASLSFKYDGKVIFKTSIESFSGYSLGGKGSKKDSKARIAKMANQDVGKFTTYSYMTQHMINSFKLNFQ